MKYRPQLIKYAYIDNLFRTLIQLVDKEGDIRTIRLEIENIKKYLKLDLK